MAKYASIIEHDRIIASDRMIPTGARPSADPNLANQETSPASAPTTPSEPDITGWVIQDISQFQKSKEFNASSYGDKIYSIIFKADGTKIYTLGTDNVINEFDITNFDISTLSYVDSYTINCPNSSSIFISEDGLNLFVGRNDSNIGSVWQFKMTSAYDISTLYLYDRYSFRESIKGVNAIYLSEEGYHMYLAVEDGIHHVKMDFAYNMGSISYIEKYDVPKSEGSVFGFLMTPDGTIAYIQIGSYFKQYNLGTPYYLSDVTYDNKSFPATNLLGLYARDGNTLYAYVDSIDYIYQYVLTYPGDIDLDTSGTLLSQFVTDTESQIWSMHLSPDGVYLFIVGTIADRVAKYTMSTPYDLTTATLSEVLSTSGQVGMAISNDGTKMYTLSSSTIYQYDLSTPWLLSSASVTATKGGIPGSPNLRGLSLDHFGKKIYFTTSDGRIGQLNMSSEFDLTTFTSYQTIDLGSTWSYLITVSDDGKFMYFNSSNNLKKYSLSTEYDVTTASLVSSQSVITLFAAINPYGGYYDPGTGIFYVSHYTTKNVYAYQMTLQ